MKAINKKEQINFEDKKEVGHVGEGIACTFLLDRGFSIIERNYLKKWGEIDIIAVKDSVLTFIEVKSVIDTRKHSAFRPEDKVHRQKQLRLRRTMQTYMAQHKYPFDLPFMFHILVVKMNTDTRRARVSMIENVIL